MSYVLSLDEGTTSARAVIFTEDGRTVAQSGLEFQQHFPRAGWVEHDSEEIWSVCRSVIGSALGDAQLTAADISCVGITNQRETVVAWDRATGASVHRAIVWQDTRGGEYVDRLAPHAERIAELTGLPVNTYFSAIKIMWLLDNVEGLRERAERGEVVFGTVDSWLIYKLTGGEFVTDITNASRTMLMDIRTGQWSAEMCELTGIPAAALPQIRPSTGSFGTVKTNQLLAGTPITGVLGDQQAALFGQACLRPGDTKVTYGTGCFLLTHTGDEPVASHHGLVSTVAYQLEGEPIQYALEGSIAVAGSLVQWLRDSLGIISTSAEVEKLAATVPDTGDVYFVPAFSGLFAPRWRPDARGTIVGLTRFSTRAHIARAALESTVFQTAEVIAAIEQDTGTDVTEIKADGGMSVNSALMQFQADIADVTVRVPESIESTATGACFAAGVGAGLIDLAGIPDYWRARHTFAADMDEADRRSRLACWDRAVRSSLGWIDPDSAPAG